MMKRTVKSLLGIVESKDTEWELAQPSPVYMPQVGFGATPDAIRWAYIGYMLELGADIDLKFKKLAGRPKLKKYQDIDCRRAFAIWIYVHESFSNREHCTMSNRELIEQLKSVSAAGQIDKRLFRECSRLEASVSDGRKKLQIGDCWDSKVCEELYRDLS
jgi:hypothetical protein